MIHLSENIYRTRGTTTHNGSNPKELIHTESISKGFRDAGFHKFDFGVIGGVGIEYNQYLLNINYEAGLLNLMSGLYDGDNPSWKNQNITISVGYFFKKQHTSNLKEYQRFKEYN